MRKKRIIYYLKQHPELLAIDTKKEHPFISDEDIPDINWFVERNQQTIKVPAKKIENKRWYFSKPFLIPVATAMLLVLFLTVTPIGQAAASVIYKTVVNWFSGNVSITSNIGHIPPKVDDGAGLKTPYKSLDEVRSKYNLKAVHNDTSNLSKIEAEENDGIIIINSTYTLGKGQEIQVIQIVVLGETTWGASIDTGEGQTVDETLSDGTRYIGYVKDNTAYAAAYIKNMSTRVSSNAITYEEFINFIRNIKID